MLYELYQGKVEVQLAMAMKTQHPLVQWEYKRVWAGIVSTYDEKQALDELFYRFNRRIPTGYTGRSMAVGDVVRLNDKWFLCTGTGWEEVK